MESQQSLFAENAQSVVSVQKQAAAFDPFGCCGRYAECSDAGVCVNPGEEMRASCAYQKKLSQGVIFYGKNAINFNRARYDSYADAINILTAGERAVLTSLFHLSFAEQRGTYRAFFSDEPEFPVLEQSGFIKVSRDAVPVLCAMSWNALKEPFGNAKPAVSPGGRIEFCQWLMKSDPELAYKLCGGFHYIEFPLSYVVELHEIYKDFFTGCNFFPCEKYTPSKSKFMKDCAPYKMIREFTMS